MANYKKSENTREQILKTASELFYEKGYKSTTVREVARQAGLSLSRLNYHFNSKADLASYIVERFLLNFEHTMCELDYDKSDRLLCNVIHIRLIEKFFLSDDKAMNFYYEMAVENNLHTMMIESDYRHFLQQSKYLKLETDRQTLRMTAHIFIGSMIRLFCAKREGDLNAPDRQILDICNNLHLKLLDIDEPERVRLIAAAHDYTRHLRFETDNLFSVRVIYSA